MREVVFMRAEFITDVKSYISEKRTTFSEQAESVADFAIFDFNYVPEKPLIRTEMTQIIDALIRYEKTGIPTNLVIFGSRGCGKTLTLKYLSRLMKKAAIKLPKGVGCKNSSRHKLLIRREMHFV